MYLMQTTKPEPKPTPATPIPIKSYDSPYPNKILDDCVEVFLEYFSVPGTNPCTKSTFMVIDNRSEAEGTVMLVHTHLYERETKPKTEIARLEFELPMEVLIPVEMATRWLNEGVVDFLEGDEYVYRW